MSTQFLEKINKIRHDYYFFYYYLQMDNVIKQEMTHERKAYTFVFAKIANKNSEYIFNFTSLRIFSVILKNYKL